MAAFFINSANSVTTNANATDALTLAMNDRIFVSRTGFLAALGTGSDALQLASFNKVDVTGEIYSAFGSGINATGGGHEVTIGAGGYVSGEIGFQAAGGTNNIVNAGTLAGHALEAISITGDFNRIINNGQILGTNSGSLGIKIFGSNNYIENNGEITTNGNEAIGILIVAAVLLPFQTNTIVNRGLLSTASTTAIDFEGARDAVINGGTIRGDVELGGGNDYFDGRGGTVDGIVLGEAGDDWFVGADTAIAIDGGAGSDTISYAGHVRGVIFDASVGLTYDGIRLTEHIAVENAIGTAFNDSFFGNAADNTFDAGAAGTDIMIGGSGRDTIAYINAHRGVIVDLNAQLAFDGLVNDVLSSVENATGSAFNDGIFGDGGDNVLNPGQAGQDQVNGFGGNDTVSYANSWFPMIIDLTAQAAFDGTLGDTLSSIENATGSPFNDQMFGDGAANIFEGGVGADTIFTGGGADRVVFRSSTEFGDSLTDFQVGVDKIVLHRAGFDDITALVAGVNFISGAAPAPTAAVPTLLYVTGTGQVVFDADGTGVAFSFAIATLPAKPALSVTDFILV